MLIVIFAAIFVMYYVPYRQEENERIYRLNREIALQEKEIAFKKNPANFSILKKIIMENTDYLVSSDKEVHEWILKDIDKHEAILNDLKLRLSKLKSQ